MQKLKEQLIITKEDREILIACLRESRGRTVFDRENMEALESELKKAKLVSTKNLPDDVVRLNSTVIVREENSNKDIKLMLVTPERADIKSRKISVLAPLGTALLGYRKGQSVQWQVPAGTKTYMITNVQNETTEKEKV